jgi:hypothetical protein
MARSLCHASNRRLQRAPDGSQRRPRAIPRRVSASPRRASKTLPGAPGSMRFPASHGVCRAAMTARAPDDAIGRPHTGRNITSRREIARTPRARCAPASAHRGPCGTELRGGRIPMRTPSTACSSSDAPAPGASLSWKPLATRGACSGFLGIVRERVLSARVVSGFVPGSSSRLSRRSTRLAARASVSWHGLVCGGARGRGCLGARDCRWTAQAIRPRRHLRRAAMAPHRRRRGCASRRPTRNGPTARPGPGPAFVALHFRRGRRGTAIGQPGGAHNHAR